MNPTVLPCSFVTPNIDSLLDDLVPLICRNDAALRFLVSDSRCLLLCDEERHALLTLRPKTPFVIPEKLFWTPVYSPAAKAWFVAPNTYFLPDLNITNAVQLPPRLCDLAMAYYVTDYVNQQNSCSWTSVEDMLGNVPKDTLSSDAQLEIARYILDVCYLSYGREYESSPDKQVALLSLCAALTLSVKKLLTIAAFPVFSEVAAEALKKIYKKTAKGSAAAFKTWVSRFSEYIQFHVPEAEVFDTPLSLLNRFASQDLQWGLSVTGAIPVYNTDKLLFPYKQSPSMAKPGESLSEWEQNAFVPNPDTTVRAYSPAGMIPLTGAVQDALTHVSDKDAQRFKFLSTIANLEEEYSVCLDPELVAYRPSDICTYLLAAILTQNGPVFAKYEQKMNPVLFMSIEPDTPNLPCRIITILVACRDMSKEAVGKVQVAKQEADILAKVSETCCGNSPAAVELQMPKGQISGGSPENIPPSSNAVIVPISIRNDVPVKNALQQALENSAVMSIVQEAVKDAAEQEKPVILQPVVEGPPGNSPMSITAMPVTAMAKTTMFATNLNTLARVPVALTINTPLTQAQILSQRSPSTKPTVRPNDSMTQVQELLKGGSLTSPTTKPVSALSPGNAVSKPSLTTKTPGLTSALRSNVSPNQIPETMPEFVSGLPSSRKVVRFSEDENQKSLRNVISNIGSDVSKSVETVTVPGVTNQNPFGVREVPLSPTPPGSTKESPKPPTSGGMDVYSSAFKQEIPQTENFAGAMNAAVNAAQSANYDIQAVQAQYELLLQQRERLRVSQVAELLNENAMLQQGAQQVIQSRNYLLVVEYLRLIHENLKKCDPNLTYDQFSHHVRMFFSEFYGGPVQDEDILQLLLGDLQGNQILWQRSIALAERCVSDEAQRQQQREAVEAQREAVRIEAQRQQQREAVEAQREAVRIEAQRQEKARIEAQRQEAVRIEAQAAAQTTPPAVPAILQGPALTRAIRTRRQTGSIGSNTFRAPFVWDEGGPSDDERGLERVQTDWGIPDYVFNQEVPDRRRRRTPEERQAARDRRRRIEAVLRPITEVSGAEITEYQNGIREVFEEWIYSQNLLYVNEQGMDRLSQHINLFNLDSGDRRLRYEQLIGANFLAVVSLQNYVQLVGDLLDESRVLLDLRADISTGRISTQRIPEYDQRFHVNTEALNREKAAMVDNENLLLDNMIAIQDFASETGISDRLEKKSDKFPKEVTRPSPPLKSQGGNSTMKLANLSKSEIAEVVVSETPQNLLVESETTSKNIVNVHATTQEDWQAQRNRLIDEMNRLGTERDKYGRGSPERDEIENEIQRVGEQLREVEKFMPVSAASTPIDESISLLEGAVSSTSQPQMSSAINLTPAEVIPKPNDSPIYTSSSQLPTGATTGEIGQVILANTNYQQQLFDGYIIRSVLDPPSGTVSRGADRMYDMMLAEQWKWPIVPIPGYSGIAAVDIRVMSNEQLGQYEKLSRFEDRQDNTIAGMRARGRIIP